MRSISAAAILFFLIVNDVPSAEGQQPRALVSFSFGGLEDLVVEDAVRLLVSNGYAGIAGEGRGAVNQGRLRQYLKWANYTDGEYYRVECLHCSEVR